MAWAGSLVLLGLSALLLIGDDDRKASTRLARQSPEERSLEPDSHARTRRGELDRRHVPHPELVAGRILDVSDGPLAEGLVELRCPDGTLHARAPIDEQGWFEAPACAELTCAVLIHPTSEQREPWRLRSGTVVELEVEPAPTLSGRVMSEGEALADAMIVLRRGERRWTSSSDFDGEFAIGLPRQNGDDPCVNWEDTDASEPIRVLVQAGAQRPWFGEIASEDLGEPLSIELLEPAAPLRGRLLDQAGLPFSRTRVLAASAERPDEVHAALLDAAGEFELRGLGDGNYDIRAIRDGQELAGGKGKAGDALELRSERSARGATLELLLQDMDGRARADVRVDGGPLRAASSDDEGIVLADDVLSGRYRVQVRAPGCATQVVTIVVDETAFQTIPIELPSTCS